MAVPRLIYGVIILLLTVPALSHGCTDGDLQLVRHGGHNYVQYCYRGQWSQLCDRGSWTENEAKVACRQLGYSSEGAISGFGNDSALVSRFFEIDDGCKGTESSIQQCGDVDRDSCSKRRASTRRTRTRKGSSFATLQCKLACNNGEVRLMNGTTFRDGRVEVCSRRGQWESVCRDSNQQEIANAVCSELGFSAEGAITISSSVPNTMKISTCKLQRDGIIFNCTQMDSPESCHPLGAVCRISTCDELERQCPSTEIQCPTTLPSPQEKTTIHTKSSAVIGVNSTEAITQNCYILFGPVIGVMTILLIAAAMALVIVHVVMKGKQSKRSNEPHPSNIVASVSASVLQSSLENNPAYGEVHNQIQPQPQQENAYEIVSICVN